MSINILSTEVLAQVMSFLDIKSLILSCSLLSREWNRTTKLNSIWKLIFDQLFMDSVFNWSEYLNNHDDHGEESTECEKSKKRKKSNSSSILKQKKQKSEENCYWFNLFKECILKFPFLEQPRNSELLDFEEIKKIKNVEKLYEIIYNLLETIEEYKNDRNNDSHLESEIQFKYYTNPNNKKDRQRLIMLATILSVLYNQRSVISYFSDQVLISMKKNMYTQENIDQFQCSLPTFCMLVLYPQAIDNIFEKDGKQYFVVAPYLEGEVTPNENCCFWSEMSKYYEYQGKDTIHFFEDFSWCPNFINSGSDCCFIDTCINISESTITVSKFEGP